jgi:hypothetical protein
MIKEMLERIRVEKEARQRRAAEATARSAAERAAAQAKKRSNDSYDELRRACQINLTVYYNKCRFKQLNARRKPERRLGEFKVPPPSPHESPKKRRVVQGPELEENTFDGVDMFTKRGYDVYNAQEHGLENTYYSADEQPDEPAF